MAASVDASASGTGSELTKPDSPFEFSRG
jgi:hypothetical protein